MTPVFERVVCGVDSSEQGAVAAKLAARVTDPYGELSLVIVEDPSVAVHPGWEMSHVMDDLAVEARRVLDRGIEVATPAHRVETRLLKGTPLDRLLAEIERQQAALVVVGTPEHARAVGIALGSVATHLVHEAPCSVLVARTPRAGWWPQTIVVGLDGSPHSGEAAAAARRLADRFRLDAALRGGDRRYKRGPGRGVRDRT